ncbi:MAG: YdjY domain-containing protein, partial [Mariniblastus sp.]
MTPNLSIWQAMLVSMALCLVITGCTPRPEPESKEPKQTNSTNDAAQEKTSESPTRTEIQKPPIEPVKPVTKREEGLQIKSDLEQPASEPPEEIQTIDIPKTWKRLSKKEEIWIDVNSKEVIFAGHVCLNAGPLEMFVCPAQTKEHESVISAHATALQVHLALVALGANPGKTTSWDPEYRAAYGPTIEVTLKWKDQESGKPQTSSAKNWIRNAKTKKAMNQQWVFGGSQFWEDPASDHQEKSTVDKQSGYGESLRGGGAICFGHKAVTNFLEQQGFSYIMRAHEAHAEGVAVSKGARVFTVFSTS